MINLPLELLRTAKKFVTTMLPTFKEVSDDYYMLQYGHCPYLNYHPTTYPVKTRTFTPYIRAMKFLEEASIENLVEIRVNLDTNSLTYPLETKLFILYRDINREVITYDIPVRFLLVQPRIAKAQFKAEVTARQAKLKEDLEILIKESKEQQKIREKPRYAEYLKLKAKYGGKEHDIN